MFEYPPEVIDQMTQAKKAEFQYIQQNLTTPEDNDIPEYQEPERIDSEQKH